MSRERLLILLSFGIIYIVWGSTYLANRFAIDTIPPFLMAASRFFLAGTLLLVLTAIFGQLGPVSARQWRNLAWSGFLFLSVGVGGVVWAEQFIDSGITAVIISLEPLIVVLIMWLVNQQRPGWSSWVGIALGIIGTCLLINQDVVVSDWNDWMGIGAIFISITAWGWGSVFLSNADMPASKMQSASLQMLLGSLFLFPMALVNSEVGNFNLSEVHQNSWLAYGFLVVFGSIIGFSAFNYLLTKVTPDKVATATYVHPVVAILLGWSMRGEIITWQIILAILITLTGVVFINMTLPIRKWYIPIRKLVLTKITRRAG